MVDGGGGRPFWGGSSIELSHSQLFTTECAPNASTIHLTKAGNWTVLPHSKISPLEFKLQYCPQSGRIPEFLQFEGEKLRTGESITLWGVIFSESKEGYDRIAICPEKNFNKAWAVLSKGEWSDTLIQSFSYDGSQKRGTFFIILEHLDSRTGAFSIYFSQMYPIDGFTQPLELGAELVEKFGTYINHPGFSEHAMGWFEDGFETFIRLMEYQNEWLGRAGRYLM